MSNCSSVAGCGWCKAVVVWLVKRCSIVVGCGWCKAVVVLLAVVGVKLL